MSQEVELQNLVTRLTGDGSGFQNMIREAMQTTKEFGRTVTEVMATVVEAVGGKEVLGAYSNLETATVRLSAALKGSGKDAQSGLADFKAFAEEMEETTLQSRASTIALSGQATQLHLFGEQAKETIKAASGLAALQGGSVSAALAGLSVYQRTGNYRALAEFIPSLRRGGRGAGTGEDGGGGGERGMDPEFIKKEVEQAIKIGLETEKQLRLDTLSGQLKVLTNNFESLKEQLGEIVSKYTKPVVKWFTDVVKWVKELDPQIKEMAVALGAVILVLTGAGPLMRFVSLLISLVANISPITIGLTAAAAATAFWIRSVGGLSAAWDIARGKFVEFVNLGIQQMGDFISAHKELTIVVAATAGAIGSAVVVWKGLVTVFAIANGLVDALYVKQILSRVATVAWTAALIAANIAMQVFSAGALLWKAASLVVLVSLVVLKSTLVLLTGLLGFSAAGWSIYTIGATIGKVATWLFNAALTVAHILLSFGITLLVAAGIAAIAFGVALGLATTAVTALYAGVTALIAPLVAVWSYLENVNFSLAHVMDAVPPLRTIIPILNEWWGILKSIVKAMTVNMPLAWQLVVAGATLAYLEVKALWPPLWEYISSYARQVWPPVWGFIQAGFAALGEFMATTLVQSLANAGLKAVEIFKVFFGALALAIANPAAAVSVLSAATKVIGKFFGEAIAKNAAQALEDQLKAATDDLQNKLKDVKVKFGAVVDTPEIIEARKRVEELQKQIEKSTAQEKKEQKDFDPAAPFKQGTKEIEKFEAVLAGSAEALSHTQEYLDKLNEIHGPLSKEGGGVGSGESISPAAAPTATAPTPAGGGGGNGGIEGLLKDIARAIRDDVSRERPVTIRAGKPNLGKG